MIVRMGADAAAVTAAEAAQYRAAGWWTDATLSERVTLNGRSTPDKPAYIDFSLAESDRVLT
jgi:acyl-CoA synthetase